MRSKDVYILISAFLVFDLSFPFVIFIKDWFHESVFFLVFLGLYLNIKKQNLTSRCLETHLCGQSTSKYPHGDLNNQDEALSLRRFETG